MYHAAFGVAFYFHKFFSLQKTSSCEVREGTCYETGTGMNEMNDDELLTAEIPAPRLTITEPPVPTTDTITEIYMDLEATGLGKLYNDSTRSRFFKFHMGT